MNIDQERAATQLLRAMNRCHSVGLQGSVIEINMCVWPKDSPHPLDAPDFFAAIEQIGRVISTPMNLDGGAV